MTTTATSRDNAKAFAYTAYHTAVVKADADFAKANRIAEDLYARAATARATAIQAQNDAYDLAMAKYTNSIKMASK
jgi:hypothetical protein